MKPFCTHLPLGKEQGRLAYCLRPSQRLGIAHILPTSFYFQANIHTNTGKAGKRREADFCSLMLNAKFELFPTARRMAISAIVLLATHIQCGMPLNASVAEQLSSCFYE